MILASDDVLPTKTTQISSDQHSPTAEIILQLCVLLAAPYTIRKKLQFVVGLIPLKVEASNELKLSNT